MEENKTIKHRNCEKRRILYNEYRTLRELYPHWTRRQAYLKVAAKYMMSDSAMQRIIKFFEGGYKKD